MIIRNQVIIDKLIVDSSCLLQNQYTGKVNRLLGKNLCQESVTVALFYWKCNFPMHPHVRFLMVGGPVSLSYISFLKRQCCYRSTCVLTFLFILAITIHVYIYKESGFLILKGNKYWELQCIYFFFRKREASEDIFHE